MTYYGGEGESLCTCHVGKGRETCPYHLFRDLAVARSRGVSVEEVRMEKLKKLADQVR
jgi:hypothetical protein